MSTPLAALEVLSARADEEPEGTIAFVVRDHVNTHTMMSLLHTDWRFLGGKKLDQVVIKGSVLTMQRNEAVQRMRGRFLLFIDDDMVWRPDAIGRLIAGYEELRVEGPMPFMLGALCFRRQAPYQPTLYVRESPTAGAYNYLERWDEGYVEVDATGCAFLLIPVEVFEVIAGTPMPPYEERTKMPGLPSFFRWATHYGEDLQFCQDAKAAGVKVFVDTRIEVGHMAEVEVRRDQFLQAMATRPAREYADRLIVNKRMGLETLAPTDAKVALGWLPTVDER
jgi:hypothetical protein